MRYAVSHKTHYAYGTPVDVGQHMLRLTPLDVAGQKIEQQQLSIEPRPDQFVAFIDHFGNAVHYASVETMHEQFSVTLDAVVEVARHVPEDAGPAWEEVREAMRSDGFPDTATIAELVFPSPLAALDEGATRYAAVSFTEKRPLRAALADLTARI